MSARPRAKSRLAVEHLQVYLMSHSKIDLRHLDPVDLQIASIGELFERVSRGGGRRFQLAMLEVVAAAALSMCAVV